MIASQLAEVKKERNCKASREILIVATQRRIISCLVRLSDSQEATADPIFVGFFSD